METNKPPKISCSLKQNEKDMMFIEENLKKKLVKNVNLPKFLGKCFMKHISEEKIKFSNDPMAFSRLIRRCEELNEWLSENKNHYLSLKHLQQFFGDSSGGTMNSELNRKCMRSILREAGSEILENHQIEHKLSYLVSTKTFALRCMNSKLTGRVQSK